MLLLYAVEAMRKLPLCLTARKRGQPTGTLLPATAHAAATPIVLTEGTTISNAVSIPVP